MSCILKFRSLKISLETPERSFHRGLKTEISREASWDIWNSPSCSPSSLRGRRKAFFCLCNPTWLARDSKLQPIKITQFFGTGTGYGKVEKQSNFFTPKNTKGFKTLACSRLRDDGGKSFSNKKCEKRAPFPKSCGSYFRFARFNTFPPYYLRAWHRLLRRWLITSFREINWTLTYVQKFSTNYDKLCHH